MKPAMCFPAVLLSLAFVVPAMAHPETTVPAGTAIGVTLDQFVSSKTAKVGQAVTGSRQEGR